jgi:hypothetical protein
VTAAVVFVPAMLAGMALARSIFERPEPVAPVAPPVGATR